ncbi:MAG: ABC transporter ATP-binding protein, partial [Halobacteriales archaeon]|nr:ABC transporter ATP-binding protein [Halobacteriales archaeon]
MSTPIDAPGEAGPADVSLRVENLKKTFGDEVAVDDLSIEVDRGTLKSLLGPSGCGKTTTLRCIAGLERPDSGRIYIDDELVTDPEDGVHTEPENRGIGMVFQSYAVWPHMTVEENVMYPLKIQKIGTKAERKQRVADVLEAVGLTPYADNLATNLSGGQQQRVAISRALVVEPDILLFDEPLSNLDAKLRREMRMEIKRIYREFNTTVLYV